MQDNWKLIEKRLAETKVTVQLEGMLAALALLAIGFAFGFTLGVFV